MALLLLLALLFAEKDLVADPGFEKGLGDWKAQDMSGSLKADLDRKVRRSGKSAAHLLKSGGPSQFRADGFALSLPEVSGGVKVFVSAQVRGQGMKNGWLKFMAYDDGGNQLLDAVAVNDDNLLGTFDWRKVEKEFLLPDEAVRAELVLYLYLDGECWLDDVSVMPQGKAKPRAPEKVEPLDAATRKWLDAHAVKVKHTRLRGGMDDLAPLKEMLRGVRIVQLGENTHRDGACFEAKARLVRFLHEEMGFEVLAFESGLFECDRANELLRKGEGGDAMRASIFPIWWNGIVEGLFDYAAAESRGKNPLLLAGFDCRGSGNLRFELLDRLAAFLEPAGGLAEGDLRAMKALEAFMEAMGNDYSPGKKHVHEGLTAWERARKAFDDGREALVARHGEEETAFFSRVLDNWRDREDFERSKSELSHGSYGSLNLRDEAMAANLRWLAETRYPGKRIVVWAATSHLARGLAGVEMEGNSKYYEGYRNMGQRTYGLFGPQVFTLGFVAYGGKGGAFGKEFDIPKPRKDSVEEILHRYGAPLLFVDLRPEEGPFRKRLRMAPMSYSRNIVAEWPTVLDAVLYLEEMTPAK